MHHGEADARVGQFAQGIDDGKIERVVRIVDAVVARPDVEEVAEDVEVFGRTRATARVVQKDSCYAGCV